MKQLCFWEHISWILGTHLLILELFLLWTQMNVKGGFVLEVFSTELAHHLFSQAMKTMQVILDSRRTVEHPMADGAHQRIPSITLGNMFYKGRSAEVGRLAFWTVTPFGWASHLDTVSVSWQVLWPWSMMWNHWGTTQIPDWNQKYVSFLNASTITNIQL